MNRLKPLFRIWLVLCIIGLVVVSIWFRNITPKAEEEINQAIDAYKKEEFQGTIIKKFIDKNEHSFKKVIITENQDKRTILFDIETSGIYDYFEIGDSIIKEKGTLEVRIIRHDLDTILEMKFVELSDIY
ncbi:MAG TPA: hypothetical protein PLO05_09845 [Bacteroidales bacterium]|nr:hypothetical protein [Bacteroidales bacterium]HXK82448.1 hypothetical protein [Bacteroidales bacterium]